MFTVKLDPLPQTQTTLPPVEKAPSCIQKIISIFCCCLKNNQQALATQTPYDREFSAPKDVYSLYQFVEPGYPRDPHIHI